VARAACNLSPPTTPLWSDAGDGMRTVRALDDHARRRALHPALALPAAPARELPPPARPAARPLTQQHEPPPVAGDARDRERVRLRRAKAGRAHPAGEHAQPDVLPRELDAHEAGAGRAAERGERRGRGARLERAEEEEEVEGVEEARGEDVARALGLVQVDLWAGGQYTGVNERRRRRKRGLRRRACRRRRRHGRG
jgi:hypothetical protein